MYCTVLSLGEGEGVDGVYVEVLEVYCLLKQRLMDVRHSWRTITITTLTQHGKYAGEGDMLGDGAFITSHTYSSVL